MQLDFFKKLFSATSAEPNNKLKPITAAKQKRSLKNLESDEVLEHIWNNLRLDYFPQHLILIEYKIVWSSRRQKRTLASCNIRSKKITVAKELNNSICFMWISPLVYHEMCHAVLEKGGNSGRNCWHGKEFKSLESRHPQIKEFNSWIKSGGWYRTVLSDRKKEWWRKRRG